MLIELKNVSKFYYSKGIIASGFSRVNVSFDVGEFVVITGESGSGKSTLLNVISGLDSYEEGEMLIDGKQTSHYLAADFEEYRKKYIGNIFQNFNLIGSYTVYQNVELILRINGYSSDEIKKRVPEILERVGLSDYSKTKASKLSGGQKQRVAIARALAKDTAIVVADEPTGNLDSESAMEIVQLLSEIAKDKLVIVVTHNYDQFEHYATRKIKMHDGKVVEDEHLKLTKQEGSLPEDIRAKTMSVGSQIRLGIRNTFNIIPKFLLLFIVFLFVVLAVTGVYTNYQNSEVERADQGWNDYFMNYSKERLVVKKEDGSSFKEEDLNKIRKMDNVDRIFETDIVLDPSLYVENDDFCIDGYPQNINDFSGKIDCGKLPEKDSEIVIQCYTDTYLISEDLAQELIGQKVRLVTGDNEFEEEVTIAGIAYRQRQQESYCYSGSIYLTESMFDQLVRSTYAGSSSMTITAGESEIPDSYYRTLVNDNVKEGEVLVAEDWDGYYKNGKATGQTMKIKVETLFYTKTLELKVAGTYNQKNFTSKTGLKDYEEHAGDLFVNQKDYNRLFKSSDYQISVYMKDASQSDATIAALEKAGYVPLALKDTLVNLSDGITSIIQIPMTVILLLALFFIAYFVIHLILRSRGAYFNILRMLGLAKKNIRHIMDVELLTIVHLAYGVFLILVILIRMDIVYIEYLQNLVKYMEVTDYLILYGVLLVMSYLISGRFVRKMFKKTAMGSFREEE